MSVLCDNKIPYRAENGPFPQDANSRTERKGGFFARAMTWVFAKNETPTIRVLRKIAAFAVLFFLALSIIGLIALPDVISEWRRQTAIFKKKDRNGKIQGSLSSAGTLEAADTNLKIVLQEIAKQNLAKTVLAEYST